METVTSKPLFTIKFVDVYVTDNTEVNTKYLYYTLSKKLNKKLYTFTINKYLLKILLWPIGKSYLVEKISNSLIINNDKVKRALNWTPSVSFEEEISNMVEGYIKNNEK